MSKSAIKALTKAQEIIASAGVTINLVAYVTDSNVRKNWRNADALAALIINSAANAFQTENSETFADNDFEDMAEAVTRYIDSNLDDWNQKSAAFMKLACSSEIDRLAAMVAVNVAFEAHAEALEVNALVDDAVFLSVVFADNKNYDMCCINQSVEYIRHSLLALKRYNARFILKMMVSVRSLAKLERVKATENYRAMMERCAKAGYGCNEIPF